MQLHSHCFEHCTDIFVLKYTSEMLIVCSVSVKGHMCLQSSWYRKEMHCSEESSKSVYSVKRPFSINFNLWHLPGLDITLKILVGIAFCYID